LIAVLLIAASPMAEVSKSWQDVFKLVIMLVTAALGAPVTQLFKTLLKIEDRPALILTGILASGIAVLELWLSHVLVFSSITVDTFPQAFAMVFTVSTIYYAWFKSGSSVLGRGLLLKPRA